MISMKLQCNIFCIRPSSWLQARILPFRHIVCLYSVPLLRPTDQHPPSMQITPPVSLAMLPKGFQNITCLLAHPVTQFTNEYRFVVLIIFFGSMPYLTIWVQNTALYLIAVVAPFVLQACVNLITIRSWWDFHNATLGCT